MGSHFKSIIVILIVVGFWGFIGWESFNLPGLGIGIAIGIGCVLFGIYGFRNVVINDLNAQKASAAMYAPLNRIVADLAYKAGVQKPDVYAINEHAPHALSVGTSMKTAAIIVTKGLVEKLNEDELRAYVTHEFAHLKRGDHYAADIAASMAYILLLPTKPFDFINDGENIFKLISLLIFGPFAAIFVQIAAYRSIDYDADLLTAKIHGQGLSFGSALNSGQKDIRLHPMRFPHYTAPLFTVEPITQHTQAGALFVTHIPTPKRITRLKRFSQKMAKTTVYKSKSAT
jgi:heat shock protein HtpX